MADCVTALAGEQDVEFAFLTVGDRAPVHDHRPRPAGNQARGHAKGSSRPSVAHRPDRPLPAAPGDHRADLIKRPGAPLPQQFHVRLHSASTFRDPDYLTEQVLKFTSLSWRSTLPARKPVSTYYSELIADLLARFRAVPDWSPAVLNTRLKYSRWFL